MNRGIDYSKTIGQTPYNGTNEMGASLASESLPFKNNLLLGTLETQSQPFQTSNVFLNNPNGRVAPNFGSLLAQDQGGFAPNPSLFPYDQSMGIASGTTPLPPKAKIGGHSLKVMLHCFGQVEMIKDKDMPVKF